MDCAHNLFWSHSCSGSLCLLCLTRLICVDVSGHRARASDQLRQQCGQAGHPPVPRALQLEPRASAQGPGGLLRFNPRETASQGDSAGAVPSTGPVGADPGGFQGRCMALPYLRAVGVRLVSVTLLLLDLSLFANEMGGPHVALLLDLPPQAILRGMVAVAFLMNGRAILLPDLPCHLPFIEATPGGSGSVPLNLDPHFMARGKLEGTVDTGGRRRSPVCTWQKVQCTTALCGYEHVLTLICMRYFSMLTWTS